MKDKKFGAGLILGLLAGAAAGLFLSPKTGSQNREAAAKLMKDWKDAWDKGEVNDRIKEMFGDMSTQSKDMYADLRKRMLEHVDTLKDGLENVDKDKYMELVKDVIEEWKEDKKISNAQIEKVTKYLQKDYQKIINEQKKEVKADKKLIASKKDSAKKEK